MEFFRIIASLGFETEILYNYVYSKFTDTWLTIRPLRWYEINQTIDYVNVVSVFKRYNVVYPDKLDFETFEEKRKLIKEIVEFVTCDLKKPMIFIVPPSLIDWPGHDHLTNVLKEIKTEYNVPFHDFSQVMKKEKFYRDHDHLNIEGALHFTKNYLKPVLLKDTVITPGN